MARYTCPACGYRSLNSEPGGFDLCCVCEWEDDSVQRLDPTSAGGANKESLIEYQSSVARMAAEIGPVLGRQRDPNWRPATPMDRLDRAVEKPEDWCYWKR